MSGTTTAAISDGRRINERRNTCERVVCAIGRGGALFGFVRSLARTHVRASPIARTTPDTRESMKRGAREGEEISFARTQKNETASERRRA